MLCAIYNIIIKCKYSPTWYNSHFLGNRLHLCILGGIADLMADIAAEHKLQKLYIKE